MRYPVEVRSTFALGFALLGLLALIGSSATGCEGSPEPAEPSAPLVRAKPSYAETRETIHALAVELMKANEITGISLALIDDGEIVWATGWGWADVDRKLRAGPRTVYAVGSLAKPITAAAVMQAVEQGELALDDTLIELLPELDLAGDAESIITLEQLLTHRSGLPSDWFIHDLSNDPPPWTGIVEEIRGVELAATPGHFTIYSNLGMTLAGLALARERERDYETLVTETLLRPAGMRTAYFVDGPEPQPVLLPLREGPRGLDAIERAASYTRSTLHVDPEFRLAPAGGLHASVVDLASFAALLQRSGRSSAGEQVLKPESVDALLRGPAEAPALDLDQRFGYGWFLDHAELDWLGRVAWHSGRTYYHHSRLILLPDHGLAVAVLSNSLTASKALDTLAVATLTSALLEKHELEPPPPPGSLAPANDADLDTFLVRHAGAYVTPFGLADLVLREGEVEVLAPFGDVTLELLGPDRFRIANSLAGEFGFARVEGIDLMTSIRDDKVRRVGPRLLEPAPIPAAWIARLGAWALAERPGEVTTLRQPELVIVDGSLVLRYFGLLEQPPMPIDEVLLPLDDRRARIAGLARGQGTVIEVRGEGSDERLWWSGREFRRPEH